MSMIWAKPAPGRHVPMPPGLGQTRSEPVPPEGQRMEMTPFVQRRLDQGDLVPMDDPAPPAKSKGASAADGAAGVKEN